MEILKRAKLSEIKDWAPEENVKMLPGLMTDLRSSSRIKDVNPFYLAQYAAHVAEAFVVTSFNFDRTTTSICNEAMENATDGKSAEGAEDAFFELYQAHKDITPFGLVEHIFVDRIQRLNAAPDTLAEAA